MSSRAIAGYGYNDEDRNPPENFATTSFQSSTNNERENFKFMKKKIKQRKKEEAKIKKMLEQQKELEEASKFSVRRLTMESSASDDSSAEEDPLVYSVPSVLDQQNISNRSSEDEDDNRSADYHRHEHRREYARRSRASDHHERHSRERYYEENYRHHHKHKRRRSRSRDGYSKKRRTVSEIDVTKNPYKLLRPHEYTFATLHLVEDCRADPANLLYDEMHKRVVPPHPILRDALSGRHKVLRFNMMGDEAIHSLPDRYFDPKIIKKFYTTRLEKRFRRRSPMPRENSKVIPISHVRYATDDEGDTYHKEIKREIEEPNLKNLDMEQYDLWKTSELLSFEDADVNGKKAILYTKTLNNPADVFSWISYIHLQDKLIANYECGNPDAEVLNKKSLFEIKFELVNEALKKNPSNVDLTLLRISILSEFYGENSNETKSAWKHAEVKFVNSIKLWQQRLQAFVNNRTTFNKNAAIALIDECIKKFVNLKMRILVSHQPPPRTDEFLVELVLLRCKLLLEMGYADNVLSSLQALAEYHFFTKFVDEKDVTPESLFEKFWDSGYKRIGDEGALGWKNTNYEEEPVNFEEEDELEKSRLKDISEDASNPLFIKKKQNVSQLWRLFEIFRTKNLWYPIRSSAVEVDVILK